MIAHLLRILRCCLIGHRPHSSYERCGIVWKCVRCGGTVIEKPKRRVIR